MRIGLGTKASNMEGKEEEGEIWKRGRVLMF